MIFLDVGGQAGGVVGVLVGDEHGRQVPRPQAQPRQGLAHPPAGDAHIDEQMGVPAGEQGGVSGGAAGKGAECGHKYLTKKRSGQGLSEKCQQSRRAACLPLDTFPFFKLHLLGFGHNKASPGSGRSWGCPILAGERAALSGGTHRQLLLGGFQGADAAAKGADLADDVLIAPLDILYIGDFADAVGR